MEINNRSHLRFGLLTVTLICLIGGPLSVSAQDSSKSTFDKWRPKVGVYSHPGKNFDQQCGEFGDLVLELDRKKVGGMEWSCKVTKIADRGPDALRLNLICEDADIVWDEDSSPDPAKRTQKEVVTRRNEVMTLRRIDDSSVFWNITKNGKFEGREWRSAYCATKWQRSFFESRAHDDAQARVESKAQGPAVSSRGLVNMTLLLAGWRPRDGVYARPGTDFNDRCMNSGEAVIELADMSISSGASHCVISYADNQEPRSIKLGAICDQKDGSVGLVIRDGLPVAPSSERIVLTRIDDQTLSLQKSRNGEFSEPAQQLAYCPEAAQRSYTESRKDR